MIDRYNPGYNVDLPYYAAHYCHDHKDTIPFVKMEITGVVAHRYLCPMRKLTVSTRYSRRINTLYCKCPYFAKTSDIDVFGLRSLEARIQETYGAQEIHSNRDTGPVSTSINHNMNPNLIANQRLLASREMQFTHDQIVTKLSGPPSAGFNPLSGNLNYSRKHNDMHRRSHPCIRNWPPEDDQLQHKADPVYDLTLLNDEMVFVLLYHSNDDQVNIYRELCRRGWYLRECWIKHVQNVPLESRGGTYEIGIYYYFDSTFCCKRMMELLIARAK